MINYLYSQLRQLLFGKDPVEPQLPNVVWSKPKRMAKGPCCYICVDIEGYLP